MALGSLDEALKAAVKVQAADPNRFVLQQYICSHCGSKQTMRSKNEFFTEGICSECEETTDIEKAGCNFALLIVDGKAGLAMDDEFLKPDAKS
jgi:hypothetical protein